jgi:quercetin dioxygenase-like cupin family protein
MLIRFRNAMEAIWSFAKNHRSYLIVAHRMKAGDSVGLHYHRRANEWLVADSGRFILTLGDEERTIYLTGQTVTIFIPRMVMHSITILEDMKYLVLRDKTDRTVYVKKV